MELQTSRYQKYATPDSELWPSKYDRPQGLYLNYQNLWVLKTNSTGYVTNDEVFLLRMGSVFDKQQQRGD